MPETACPILRLVDLIYRAFGFPGADDLGNMFQYKAEFEEEYCAARPVDGTRSLHPGLQDFETWVRANAERIPVAVSA